MKRWMRIGLPVALAVVTVGVVGAVAIMTGAGAPRIANAQTADSTVTPQIAVVGTGSVSVTPDVAVASVGVGITAPTLSEATAQAAANMTKVLDAIKAQGVDSKDIQTSSYNVYPITSQAKEGETPKITGYHVSNIVTVKVREIDNIGKVLDAAISAGANSVNSVYFTVNDPTEAQNQARTQAVHAAMAQAQTLADAAGVKVGKILYISDTPGVVTPVFRGAVEAVPAAAGGAGPVETGQTTITASVEMRFEIVQ